MKIGLYILLVLLYSCHYKKGSGTDMLGNDELIALLKENDQKLAPPEEGDWLFSHPEPGQTFEQYKSANPVRPDSAHHTIYLLPIGNFSETQKLVIKFTADYLEIFFGVKTLVLSDMPDKIVPENARRAKTNTSEQLLAGYILDSILIKYKPGDAIAVMAITSKDLYPQGSWNYVFGLASYQQQIGVSSMFRYSGKSLDSSNYSLCLDRLIKTSAHEIGHMFSLHHCTNAYCIMNGSNSLSESDAQPDRLCSECLHKLYWDIQFNITQRTRDLKKYFQKHKLRNDFQLAEKDQRSIEGS